VIQDVFKKAVKTVSDNAPAILTGIAVVGTIGTTILAVRSTPEALRRGEEDKAANGSPQTKMELAKRYVKVYGPVYAPAIVTGALTITCIVCANRVGSRRAALLASAYSLSEKAFSDYKDAVVEQIGSKKEEKIRDSVAQNKVAEDPVSNKEVYITGNGDVLCYETITGRYFRSDIETLRKAQNDINAKILRDMYASQNEFYNLIGLAPTGMGEELGWTVDHQMDLQFSSVLSEDNKPCLALGYRMTPVRDYYKFG